MPAVYSTSFFAGQNETAFDLVVPAGVVWIIRDIDAFFGGGVSGAAANWLNPTGGTFAYFPFVGLESSAFEWRGRQCFQPGEHFAFVSGEGVDVMVSGYVLTLP